MQNGASTAAKANGDKNKAAVLPAPFKTGVQYMDDDPYDETRVLTAAPQTMPQYEVPSTGYLTGLNILVEGTVSDNSTADVAFAEDDAFRVLETITFSDTNSSEIIFPLNGWDLAMINKYGGYCYQDDPRADGVYSITEGTGATGGSFSFVLHIPAEFVPRDALGALPNKSASTPYKLKMTLAGSADLFTTAPDTTLPSVRVRVAPDSYWEPQEADSGGRPIAPEPPGVNTTQYWQKTDITVNAGSISELLTNSTGFPVRNLIFVLRDSNGSRAQGESDFPDPFYFQVQSNTMRRRIKSIWRTKIARDYDYAGLADTAGSKDNGVYVEPFCRDFYPKPGWETRRSYLRTQDGTRLQVRGTIGGSGSHTLTVLTNYVGIAQGTTLSALTS